MQFYLFNIHPKLHHWKWRKLRATLPVNRRNKRALFLVCCLRDDNVITSKPAWNQAYKLYLRVFWIYLRNAIKIDFI